MANFFTASGGVNPTTMNTSLQFRVLYRQFLFRLMDVELFAASAHGDAFELLGQFGSLLVFGSLLFSVIAPGVAGAVRERPVAASVWPVERFLISLAMLVVGAFTLLSWDSTFLDRRDVLVLGPLPVPARTLFAAKIAAAASSLGLTVAAWNSIGGFAFPLALTPPGSGLVGTVRFVVAFWVTFFAAGAFLYCVLLGVQAAAAQLPRRWSLRVSSVLQIAAFVLLLGIVCFQPSLDTAAALAAPENQRVLAWLPSYWFTGFLSEMSGAFPAESHAVMAPLAHRAVASLAVAICVAGGAFLLSYLRTLRKIVEEPDVVPGAHGGIWLPRFGNSPQTALGQFVIRTLLRSQRHRAILAFYLGGGFAIAAVYWEGVRETTQCRWIELVERVDLPMLFASILMLCALWLGIRTVFSLPLDLHANWVFRVTTPPEGMARLSAVRRALVAASVFPVLAASAALLLWFWPWTTVAEHLLVLGLLGSLLADISLRDFRKIPFACSYLPGKSKVHMVFWWGVIPVVLAIHKVAQLEQRALASPLRYLALAGSLAVAVFAARLVSNKGANRSEPGIQFEESASDELTSLGLNK
ncbi:MAG TPA: hypothetical protein VEO19_07255 [Terriglobia bacterium]|nr:hypothetical protein [Terriglobia bacterium]